MSTATATRPKPSKKTVEVLSPPGTGENPQATFPVLPNLHAEWVLITPELAAEYLELNEKNRPKRQNRIDAIAADLLGDDWEPNGATIVFAPGGWMLDGQHRCEGIVSAAKAAVTLVAWGIRDQARKVIDSGAARTVADWVTMEKELKNPTVIQAIARRWHGWNTLPPDSRYLLSNHRPSHGAVIKTIELDQVVLVQATNFASWARGQSAKKGMKKVNSSVWGIAYVVMLEAFMGDTASAMVGTGKPFIPTSEAIQNVRYFLDRCVTGEGLKKGDPELAFRDRMMNAMSGSEAMPERNAEYLLFTAWQLWRGKKQATKLPLPRMGVNAATFPSKLY